MTGKYEPLSKHLGNSGVAEVTMSFDLISRLVDVLPPSAYQYAAWWANDRTHVQAKAWIAAGWRVSGLDLSKNEVAFSRN